jgi:tetratricopeptide (TPR) repeat protein
MPAPGQTTIIRKKRRRRRRRAPLFPFVLLGLAVIGVMLGAMWLVKRRPAVNTAKMPDGYISDTAALKQEYQNYYGNENEYSQVAERFGSANDLAGKRNLPAVASVLDAVSKLGAVPVIFHNLGVAYAGLNDYPRAAESFREALARDPEYGPTRKFLRGARGITPGMAEPFTREVEPNNSSLSANLIALRSPVGGEIAGASDTSDYFRVIAPPAPRDLISIEIANHSGTFAPQLRVYDSAVKMQSWGEKVERVGKSIKAIGGPPPNSALYLSISGEDGKSGLYLLTVTPLKAFDRYEPNDEIMAARKISIGEEISANIMDEADKDFYSFQSPRKGQVTVEIRNRAPGLAPVLAVYNRERRNIGFAPDVKPGANLRYSLETEKDLTYYLHVASQAGTSGAYSLRVD